MRAVVQRVSDAKVSIGERVAGEIGRGLLVLLGISPEDGEREVEWIADKIVNLRIFNDEDGKMNRSLGEIAGQVLIVSQFTLYGDARRGRRPSFAGAASGPQAEALYGAVIDRLRSVGIGCAAGEWGAMMDVSLTNEGPVTILLDSEKRF